MASSGSRFASLPEALSVNFLSRSNPSSWPTLVSIQETDAQVSHLIGVAGYITAYRIAADNLQ
jgi:hypothetical protein